MRNCVLSLQKFAVVFHFALLIGALSPSFADVDGSDFKLIYAQPAGKRSETLPIGNGQTWALLFGGVPDERIQFGQEKIHRGDAFASSTKRLLFKLHQLLGDKTNQASVRHDLESILSDPIREQMWERYGDLRIDFPYQESAQDYRRLLDLETGVVTTEYRVGEISYRLEAFVSGSDPAIVIRILTDHQRALSFIASLTGPKTNTEARITAPDQLSFSGRVEEGRLNFETRLKIVVVNAIPQSNENTLSVQNADSALLLLVSAGSETNQVASVAGLSARCENVLVKLSRQTYQQLLSDHLAAYRKMIQRESESSAK